MTARDDREKTARVAGMVALLTVLSSSLVALSMGWWLTLRGWSVAAAYAGQLAVAITGGLLAARLVGSGLRGEASRLRSSFLWTAVAVGVALFGVGRAWLALLPPQPEMPVEAPFVAAVLIAPMLEEWLSRGVGWEAARRFASPAGAVVLTAALFSLCHGLFSDLQFDLPFRFIAGLALGGLRYRSRALLPCVVAHAVSNALAWSV